MSRSLASVTRASMALVMVARSSSVSWSMRFPRTVAASAIGSTDVREGDASRKPVRMVDMKLARVELVVQAAGPNAHESLVNFSPAAAGGDGCRWSWAEMSAAPWLTVGVRSRRRGRRRRAGGGLVPARARRLDYAETSASAIWPLGRSPGRRGPGRRWTPSPRSCFAGSPCCSCQPSPRTTGAV